MYATREPCFHLQEEKLSMRENGSKETPYHLRQTNRNFFSILFSLLFLLSCRECHCIVFEMKKIKNCYYYDT